MLLGLITHVPPLELEMGYFFPSNPVVVWQEERMGAVWEKVDL